MILPPYYSPVISTLIHLITQIKAVQFEHPDFLPLRCYWLQLAGTLSEVKALVEK